MNRGLAVFAFVLVVLGAATGFYPISVLGGILLLAALFARSVPLPPRPQPNPPERRRTTVPTSPPPVAAAALPQSQMQHQAAQARAGPGEAQGTVTIPALFPTTMFPSMNPTVSSQRAQDAKPSAEKPESRDEIVELAAVAVLLRLLSG